MPYDGSQWDESNPTNSTLANEIDDVSRDMKIGVRSRMAQEHIWPSVQTGTSGGGYHSYISFQSLTATPAVPVVAATTQSGILFMSGGNLIFENSAGTLFTVISSGNVLNVAGAQYSATGTLGDVLVGTGTGLVRALAASAPGLALITNTNTAVPNWQAVLLLSQANTVSGLTTFATNVNFGGNTLTAGLFAVAGTGNSGNLNNGTSYTVPAGNYVTGIKRGASGEIDQVFYAHI